MDAFNSHLHANNPAYLVLMYINLYRVTNENIATRFIEIKAIFDFGSRGEGHQVTLVLFFRCCDTITDFYDALSNRIVIVCDIRGAAK